MSVTEINRPAEAVATNAIARHRAEASDLPPVRGQSFLLLVRTELRKSVNTRSGRVLLLAILALALFAIGWQLTHMEDGGKITPEFFVGATATGVMLILPVIGVMAMTSEWSQRTALTTFTLSPRRVRVQLAKFVSAIVLSVVVLTATTLLALIAVPIGGAISGNGSSFAGLGTMLSGIYLSAALNVVMGAAFGAVLANTAVAIVVYFIAPTAWSLAGPALFKDNAQWLDVFGAFGRIAERDLNGMLPETLTALTVWIVLPTVVGLWASSRREVK